MRHMIHEEMDNKSKVNFIWWSYINDVKTLREGVKDFVLKVLDLNWINNTSERRGQNCLKLRDVIYGWPLTWNRFPSRRTKRCFFHDFFPSVFVQSKPSNCADLHTSGKNATKLDSYVKAMFFNLFWITSPFLRIWQFGGSHNYN